MKRRHVLRENYAAGLIMINPRYPAFGGGFECYWTAERAVSDQGLFWTFGTAPSAAEARRKARAYLDGIPR